MLSVESIWSRPKSASSTTLRELLRERRRIPLAKALPILREIARAIDAAHKSRIVHRDLRPDNIVLMPDGRARLIEFGFAPSVLASDTTFGTLLYMSPEQCRGTPTDLRTDLYSFGALAYHVLVGEPPFEGDPLEIALHHLNDPPRAPSSRCGDLNARVDEVLLALLAKDPDDRPYPIAPTLESMVAPRRCSYRWLRGALGVFVGERKKG